MLKSLKNGQSVAFTADQPPGPGKVAGKGSIILAKLSGCPIIPVAATTSRRFEFDSWDNFWSEFLWFGDGGTGTTGANTQKKDQKEGKDNKNFASNQIKLKVRYPIKLLIEFCLEYFLKAIFVLFSIHLTVFFKFDSR